MTRLFSLSPSLPGLSPSCETLLLSEMTVTRALLKILNSNIPFTDTLNTNASSPNGYKFFVPRNVDICKFKLTITKTCNECRDINFYVQAHSVPTSKNYLHSALINVSAPNSVIEFYPHEDAWHYVDLKFVDSSNGSLNSTSGQRVEYSVTIEFQNKKQLNEEEIEGGNKYIPPIISGEFSTSIHCCDKPIESFSCTIMIWCRMQMALFRSQLI